MSTPADMEVLPPIEEQPELLDVMLYPRRLEVERLAKQGSCLPANPTQALNRCSNQRTGKILLKQLRNDPEFAEALCAALSLGMATKIVAKRFSISPESVAVVREAMTDRGELRPVRLRVQAKIDRLAEDGLDETWEGLMAGKIHPGQGWIPTLATVDKRAQAEAGMVVGTDRTVEEVSVARLMAARDLVLAHRAATDSESVAEGAKGAAGQASEHARSNAATVPATVRPALGAGDEAGRVRLEMPAAREAGGGDRPAAAGTARDTLPSKILDSKGTS